MKNPAYAPNILTTGQAGESAAHESAHLHVTGEAVYTDDVAELAGTLHAALGCSTVAHAKITSLDLAGVRSAPGVVAVFTADDIPGPNDCGPIIKGDDPILVADTVQCIGQPIFLVVGETRDAARRAVGMANIQYAALPAVLTPKEAHRQGSYVLPPIKLTRGEPAQKLASAPRTLEGEINVGGQEHFYLEGQICYALPTEDGGLHLHSSTQYPAEMQQVVAHMLKRNSNQIHVQTRRMGGGFGGKESQSALFACCAALAADRLQRPVKLRPDRDDDMLITGKRHCFYYSYAIGFDDSGRIHAAKIEMVARAGFSADLSGPVATRAVCHFDNAYYLSDVDIAAYCGKTNTQSNTAFRGFGGPQGAIAIEYLIDNIARELDMDPLDVRKANFYGTTERNVTPYGAVVEDNIIHELVGELEHSSNYRARREAVRSFNQSSTVLKKGIAITPVKFGISFNVVHFNQAGALVHVYTDGSALVNHGGTEMGQGLNTKVAQVVAAELGISLSRIRSTATDTTKVANASATAASTGSDLNGKAAQHAARKIKARLITFAKEKYAKNTDATVTFANDQVQIGKVSVPFPELVTQAYMARVQLMSDGFYATPGLHWDKDKVQGKPFYYYTCGAGVSEVLVDSLTGEWKLLQADLLHEAGNSLNPAIDLGQIEGAFIQGMGWLTTEELWWSPAGRLMTHAPSTYKIPAVHDCPDVFITRLYDNPNAQDTIFRSKAVGEPPLLLPFSVFFAIRDAVASLADYKINPPLQAPATCEAILSAITAVQEQAG